MVLRQYLVRETTLAVFFSVCFAGPTGCSYRWELTGPAAAALSRSTLEIGDVYGVSGMAAGPTGRMWGVAERQWVLVSLTDSSGAPQIASKELLEVSLGEIPDGDDVESLAWMGEDLFAVGLESNDQARSANRILIYRFENQRALRIGQLELPWSLWEVETEANRGIEGLCYADGWLVAGGELTGRQDKRRFAPIAVTKIEVSGDAVSSDGWRPYRLWLSTGGGRLAALECARDEASASVDIWVVERQHGVARLLEAKLPDVGAEDTPGPVEPRVVADFALNVRVLPNLEGLVHRGDQHFVLVNDNQYGDEVGGPTELWDISVEMP